MEEALNRRLAGELWKSYAAAVGGKAFNGDPLPTWNDLLADTNKEKIVSAWLAVADKAIERLNKPF